MQFTLIWLAWWESLKTFETDSDSSNKLLIERFDFIQEDDGLRDRFLLDTHTAINVATQVEGQECIRGSTAAR